MPGESIKLAKKKLKAKVAPVKKMTSMETVKDNLGKLAERPLRTEKKLQKAMEPLMWLISPGSLLGAGFSPCVAKRPSMESTMGCIRTEEPVSDTARLVQSVVLEEEKVCEEKDKAFKDAAVKLKKDKEPAVTEKDLKDVAFIETNEKIN